MRSVILDCMELYKIDNISSQIKNSHISIYYIRRRDKEIINIFKKQTPYNAYAYIEYKNWIAIAYSSVKFFNLSTNTFEDVVLSQVNIEVRILTYFNKDTDHFLCEGGADRKLNIWNVVL